jgi:EmrB/QacA subfamily drug resistance transporter
MTEETAPGLAPTSILSATTLLVLPITVACGNFMVNLDQNVVVTALPGIGQTLGKAPSQLGLVMTVYVLSLIVSMPLGGWLTDRFGTRNCYCGALLSFGFASMFCGLASSLWMLVLARALQGFGGALMGTVGQVAILGTFPRSKILKINIYMSLASQLGPLIGPLVGGALTTYISWHWIFFINAPLVLAAALATITYFPATRQRIRSRLDVPGFLLMGSGMALLVFGMDSLGAPHSSGWIAALLLLLAIAVLGVVVLYFLRVPNPLLDLRLLRIRTIRVSLLTGGGVDTIGLTSVMLLLPLMFQVGFGMTAVQSGSWTFVIGIGSMLPRVIVPRLLKRFGFRRVLVFNTPIVALLVAGFALFQATTPMWIGLTYIFLFGLFRSVQWASAGNLSYADVAPEQLTNFSSMYYILWRLSVSISIGSATALLSLLATYGGGPSANDFRIVFVFEAVVTLCAILAYLRLTPQDGANVSGHLAELQAE